MTTYDDRRSSRGTGPRRLCCARHAIHRNLQRRACLTRPGDLLAVGTKSRETIYGASIRAAAERATDARKEADRLASEAWNKRMGPAQPSPTLATRSTPRLAISK
jgi:hypothetical protein